MKSLVALVLHLAEQLHAEEQQHDRAGDSADEEGHDDGTPDTSTTRS